MRALAEGGKGWIGVRFVSGRCQGKYGGVWGILDWLGFFSQGGMSLGFGILAVIPLFWDMDPVGDLAWGDGGWFRGGFGHGVGVVYWDPLGIGKMIVSFYSKNIALGMPDGRF